MLDDLAAEFATPQRLFWVLLRFQVHFHSRFTCNAQLKIQQKLT